MRKILSMTHAGTGDTPRNTPRNVPGDSPGEIADLLLRVARKIQLAEPGEGIELTHLEAMVMTRVDDEPGITPTDLRAALNLKSSNMSATLRSLEAKGLIERTRDEHDGRMVRIRSTPFSAENLSRVRAGWAEMLTDLLPDAAENAQLAVVLRRLDAGLG